MNIREAARFTGELSKHFQALGRISEVLSLLDGEEEHITALLKKRDAITSNIAILNNDAKKAQENSEKIIKQAKLDSESVLVSLKIQITTGEKRLADILKQNSDAVTSSRIALKQETASMITERRTELNAIEKQVKQKGDQLSKISQELSNIRAKVGI